MKKNSSKKHRTLTSPTFSEKKYRNFLDQEISLFFSLLPCGGSGVVVSTSLSFVLHLRIKTLFMVPL
jgi:hypothetical protein